MWRPKTVYVKKIKVKAGRKIKAIVDAKGIDFAERKSFCVTPAKADKISGEIEFRKGKENNIPNSAAAKLPAFSRKTISCSRPGKTNDQNIGYTSLIRDRM